MNTSSCSARDETRRASDSFGATLLPDAPPEVVALRSDDRFFFDDSFVSELCKAWPVRRLKRIGFLGAIDYIKVGSGRSAHRRRHNRFEHSLGVAKLADIYAQQQSLSLSHRRLVVAAALLHDVGHGPLSHTLEPIFEKEFQINHHDIGQRIIRGDTQLGDDIGRALRRHSIDAEEVIALIEGKHNIDSNFLFSSQINIDTIEGINRSRAFYGRRSAYGSAKTIINHLSNLNSNSTASLDDFWRLKNEVYNLFITSNIGISYDLIAQSYMMDNISKFKPSDFLLTEDRLRFAHPFMFKLFRFMTRHTHDLYKEVPKGWLDASFSVRKRSFLIDEDQEISGKNSIDKRYLQKKRITSVRLGDVIF